ncbi:hypothetical protein COC52_08135 [Priestia megaterium]|uniref:hypothetical protein n=1 Tax=Priestia megaterium TaxID=1404 RepID=UPI000BFCA2D6|nr:hypothetical protein [Priestia megaterium]PGR28508.1 hypothetical protein COC52_08135 [Priestia megaterium]
MDLFNVQVKESELHPNFVNIVDDPQLKEVLKKWSMGFEDRDNKFVKEFQTTFNSSFWELYLHTCFKNLGFKIDYSHHAPDFVLKTRKSKKELVVEAVTTKNAKGGTPEHDRMETLEELSKVNEEDKMEEIYEDIVSLATERIASSIRNKSEKYKKSYSALEHVKRKPFVLAVGGFEQPLFYVQGVGAIQKVLYGITKAEYMENGLPSIEYSDLVIKESNGAPIPIGIFNDDSHSHISAVIFSSVASIGKARALSSVKNKNMFFKTCTYNDYGIQAVHKVTDHTKYRESLFDGLSIYLNPYADHPLDPNEFDNPDIAVNHHLHSTKVKHGFLFSRQVINFSNNETVSSKQITNN